MTVSSLHHVFYIIDYILCLFHYEYSWSDYDTNYEYTQTCKDFVVVLPPYLVTFYVFVVAFCFCCSKFFVFMVFVCLFVFALLLFFCWSFYASL